MTPELIIGVVIAALLVYAIATHKIDLSKLKGDITSHLAAVHATAQATHAAALAPVSVVNVPHPSRRAILLPSWRVRWERRLRRMSPLCGPSFPRRRRSPCQQRTASPRTRAGR
jgi:hypothetical protein